MYAREIEGAEHTFGVSGKLIMNALVMYDHQTRTLWSQFHGSGVQGPLTGVKLVFLPVIQTQWALWLESHPDTLVLDKGGGYRRDSYDSYYRGGRAGIMGETETDNRLARKALVVGVSAGRMTKAYPLDVLARMPVINDTLGGKTVLVYMDQGTETTLVYERTVDGRELTFQLSPGATGAFARLTDEETGSTWLALTGKAIAGPLKGKTVARAQSHLSFWFVWRDWNPETEVYAG